MSKNKKMNFIKWFSAIIFFLLVAYVLSIGPVSVMYIDDSGKVSEQQPEFLKTFYSPLVWAMKKNSWFASFMMNYVEACNRYR